MGTKSEHTRLPRHKIWLYYTILFLFIGFVVFVQFALCKKTLIHSSDGYLQYYPILVKLKNFFLSTGDFTLWSWDTGLGADFIGNYALVLCDPFTYITLLFSNAYLDIGYSIMIVLKLYVAGLTMLGFLRYHKKSNWTCLLSSIGYAFCAWALISLQQEFFLNPLILFPLLIWGVDRVDDRKSPIVLILSIMASVVTSLYFSYMSAIFIALYIVTKYFLLEGKKTFRTFVIRIMMYFIYALIGGVLLSGPILLPVLHTLLQASTGSGVDSQILPTLRQLLRFLPAFAGTLDITYNYSIPGMNMLFVLMIPAMALLLRKKKPSIYLFFISTIFAIFPLAQSVINGFSYPSSRCCYTLAFFFVYAVSDCIESDILHSPKYKKSVSIWIGILFASSVAASSIKAITATELIIILINLCFCFFLFPLLTADCTITQNSINQKKIFFITLINITILPLITYWPTLGNKIEVEMQHGSCYNAYETTALKAASSIQDNDFYRIDMVDSKGNNGIAIREAHTPANANIYWQTPSISEYLSTIDKNWIKFNQQVGNSAGTFRRICVYSNDNRSRLDFLQGVRYFLADDSNSGKSQSEYAGYSFQKKNEKDGIKILESGIKTGLGYVLSHTMTESDFLEYSELEREQVLMQCAVINDEDMSSLPSYKTSEVKTNLEKIPMRICNENGLVITDHSVLIKKAGTTLKMKPNQNIKNSEVYLIFNNFHKDLLYPDQIWQMQQENNLSKLQFFCNNLSNHPYENFSITVSNTTNQVTKRILNAAGENQGIRSNENYMVNLGYFDSFNSEILCNFGTIGNYTFDSIDVVAVPVESYQQQAQTLSRNRLEITSNEGDHLKGTVNAEKDGILYMSILYTPGWNVYIDGTPADTFRVNTAFTGVQLTAGRHDVELVYHPAGYPYSLLLFAAGLALTAGCAVYFRKKGQGGKK